MRTDLGGGIVDFSAIMVFHSNLDLYLVLNRFSVFVFKQSIEIEIGFALNYGERCTKGIRPGMHHDARSTCRMFW